VARRRRPNGGQAVTARSANLRRLSRRRRRIGYPVVDDLNTDVVEGLAASTPTSAMVAAQTAWLCAAGRRRGISISVGSDRGADRHREWSGEGVEIIRQGVRETVWAEREVILRGRSTRTRSDAVRALAPRISQSRIPVALDAPEVGRNLQNHRPIRCLCVLATGDAYNT